MILIQVIHHPIRQNPLEKTFAGIGCKYDSTLDAFIPQKIFDSWIFNKDTCLYDPPVSRPDGLYFG